MKGDFSTSKSRGTFPQGGTEFSEGGEKATRGIHHFKGGLKNQAETMPIWYENEVFSKIVHCFFLVFCIEVQGLMSPRCLGKLGVQTQISAIASTDNVSCIWIIEIKILLCFRKRTWLNCLTFLPHRKQTLFPLFYLVFTLWIAPGQNKLCNKYFCKVFKINR